jgi:beta-glucanase (GH16 family)
MNWRTRTLAASSLFVLMAGARSVWAQSSFTEHWSMDSSPHFTFDTPGQSTITSNFQNTGQLRLQLPARSSVGPGAGPEIISNLSFRYGTFTTRLKTADCSAQPNAGVVTGFFTFFTGPDSNTDQNNLPQNSEIDMEWLCAAPHEIYLTMWTDFDEATSEQRRVLRYIDLRAGVIRRECYFERFGFSNCLPLSSVEAQPVDTPQQDNIPAILDYAPHEKFYTYGFTWAENCVRWWIAPDGRPEITLWNYCEDRTNPEFTADRIDRIPDLPAKYLTNIWHTTTFLPLGRNQARQKPRIPISQFIDWTAYQAP